MSARIAINGFGRIGRNTLRAAVRDAADIGISHMSINHHLQKLHTTFIFWYTIHTNTQRCNHYCHEPHTLSTKY